MNWHKLSQTSLYRGYRNLDTVTFQLPDSVTTVFEIKQEENAVCIVALTMENKVVLAQQFRPGPEKVLTELPGGGINDGEDIDEAARRELLEETGYSGELQFVGTSFADAYSTSVKHTYVARNCKRVQDPENNPREPIEVIHMNIDEFRDHLRSGELTDTASGYLGLDFLGLV